jgi:protein subunit release factor B
VKDHRTGIEIGDGKKVLDGFIDPFIEAYLKSTTSSGKQK